MVITRCLKHAARLRQTFAHANPAQPHVKPNCNASEERFYPPLLFLRFGFFCMSMCVVGAAQIVRFGVGFVWLLSGFTSMSGFSATGIAIMRFSSWFVWSRDAVLRVGEDCACPRLV